MNKKIHDVAITQPVKKFFVSMLTRDISLADAILDLIDNSLDGALRLADGDSVNYSQHYVKINLNGNSFKITDNCGGISRVIAQNYAFNMGRDPSDDHYTENETIGMYGVGMKRAIFKMGRAAKVRTLHGSDGFEVPITSDWLDNKNWDPLQIVSMKKDNYLREAGTAIEISNLYSGVSRHFRNKGFLNELRTSIAEHFTVFLQRGLHISVNGKAVDPVHIEVLVSSGKKDPAPYVFQKVIDDVIVSIAVGLNTGRGLPDEDEGLDFDRDRSAATAGWTVFCNDRAIIVGDKSRLTGWGDKIPRYHYQFSIITGIIEFRSRYVDKLPVTTTKRALDASSDIWLEALVKMKEGMRIWITYTNRWKNYPRSDQAKYWKNTKSLPLRSAIELVSKRDGKNTTGGYIEFNPQKHGVIPRPPTQKSSSRQIKFSRPVEEIQIVSSDLFDEIDAPPSVVGESCFATALVDALRRKIEARNE